MRAADLDIHELLHVVPEGGLITFAGERALLLDAVALGLLRRELIPTLGTTGARAEGTRDRQAQRARGRDAAVGIPGGQRGRRARRGRASAYDPGSRTRRGDTCLAHSFRPR